MATEDTKIVKFPHQNTPFGFATSIVDLIGKEDVKGLIVAGMMADGETFMGYSRLDYREVMELIHRLQMYALDLKDREELE